MNPRLQSYPWRFRATVLASTTAEVFIWRSPGDNSNRRQLDRWRSKPLLRAPSRAGLELNVLSPDFPLPTPTRAMKYRHEQPWMSFRSSCRFPGESARLQAAAHPAPSGSPRRISAGPRRDVGQFPGVPDPCAERAGGAGKPDRFRSGDPFPRPAGVAFPSHRLGLKSPEADDLLRKIESLRPRLSKLSEGSRRVSESLDVNTVLREVIDNARYLTGARYGALLTHEPSGSMQDLITSGTRSRGGSAADDPAPGAGTLGYMNEVREPLRLRDIASHPSSTGFPENHPPMKTFLGMALRPRRALPRNPYPYCAGVTWSREHEECRLSRNRNRPTIQPDPPEFSGSAVGHA